MLVGWLVGLVGRFGWLVVPKYCGETAKYRVATWYVSQCDPHKLENFIQSLHVTMN